MTSVWRVFGFGLRGTSKQLVLPLLGTLGIAWLGIAWQPPLQGGGAGSDAAARLWLQLPACGLAIAAVAAILEAWPLLCRDRCGATLVSRLQPRWAQGCVAAGAGALVALAGSLALSGVAFTGMLAAHGVDTDRVRQHVRFESTVGAPVLDAQRRRLVFRARVTQTMTELRLTPLAFATERGEYRPAQLRITAGGRPLHDATLTIGGSGERLSITFPAQPVGEIEIEALPGSGLLLLLQPGAVEGLLAQAKSDALNAVLAALSFLVPAALALALGSLLRGRIGLPVAVAGGTALVLASTALAATPNGAAITAYAALRWLPGENYLAMHALGLCMVLILTAGATLTGGRKH